MVVNLLMMAYDDDMLCILIHGHTIRETRMGYENRLNTPGKCACLHVGHEWRH